MTPAFQYPTIDPARLRPNPWNTNKCSSEAEAKIDESIRELQMFKPIIVRELPDGSLQILGGEHRHASALRQKIKQVPFMNLGPIDDIKAKKISLVDNGRYGDDDPLELAKLLEELGSPEDLAKYMPYSVGEFESIFAASSIDLDDLGLSDDDDKPLAPVQRPPQTHVLMRFKVPIGDTDTITKQIEAVIKQQHFTEEDSLANAGNALVHIFKNAP